MIFSELIKTRLDEIGIIVTGKTPSTKIAENFGDQYMFITPRDMDDSKNINCTERYLSDRGISAVTKQILKGRSICVSCIGSDMGKVGLCTGDCVTNQQINSITNVNENYDVDFVYYVLKPMKEYFHRIAGGSTMPIVNKSRFSEIEIDVPNFEEQKSIAHILSTLDEKIEVNNQINKTLEKIAKEIFKQWFEDFEFPNEEGEPYKSSGGKMAESELGMIPKGWEVKSTSDICQVTDYVANGSFASLKENVTYVDKESGYAVLVRLTDYNRDFEDEYVWVDKQGYDFLKKSKLFGGEIIISNVGANAGTVFRVPELGEKMTLGPNSIMLVPNEFSHYLYSYFVSRDGREKLNGIRSGSAQPKFNKTAFRSIKMVMPSKNILSDFTSLYGVLEKQMIVKENEIKLLKKTRDTLLPKLMSGEIRVPLDIEDTAS
jgi:type I restriction enzyme S subunit